MLPARFEYHRVSTLAEAFALLDALGDDAKILAGGQSLIPMMKLRFASPGHLIDINGVPGLAGAKVDGDVLKIGALTRHNDVAASDVIREVHPTISEAAPQIADPLVRNLGTIGGSLAHADPGGDIGSVMLALGARVVAQSSKGEREIGIREFLKDTFQTTLRPDEILTEIRVPIAKGENGGAYLKLERKIGDYATVGVASFLEFSNGAIGRAGVGLTSVGLINVQATTAEQALAGQEPSRELFARAGDLAAEAANPVGDVRGSVDYKRHMVKVYTERGLAAAAASAGKTI
ncbi:MAG: FAD binding domain-containing protein [Actinomycetota bacterium]